jgi:hypothetical protein
MGKSRENTGLVGDATEMLGGAVCGGGLAKCWCHGGARSLRPKPDLLRARCGFRWRRGRIGAVSGSTKATASTSA